MYDLKALESEHQQSQEVLLYFKTALCPSLHQDIGLSSNSRGCFQASCYYYHNKHEMRRPLFDEQSERLNYDPIPCGSLQEGLLCAEGSRCRFSHTQNELSYHPLYYKTESCSGCMFGNNTRLCPKYHSEETNRRSLVEKILSQQEMNDTHAQNQFNLDLFKVMPCTKKANHNLKICNYYHHDKDRRRPTNIYSYAPPMCSFVSRNIPCPMGDKCNYAHNKLEQLYHPERYKRKFCQYHPNNIHKCDYGDYCSFAHKENEIVIELLHNLKQDEYFYLYKYKTVFCPYISEHDRNLCVYAHNPQDLRRDPSQTKYNAIQCSFWSQGQIYSYEEGGCPKQMECENCHGWKELEYHPLYYKTKPCNNGKKCNKKDCPFYHSNSEKRQVKVTSQLTRSLFLLNNSPLQPKAANAGSSQAFEGEPLKASSEKKFDSAQQRTLVPLFIPFKLNDSDNMRKPDVRSCGFGSFLPSTNFTEDELPTGSSIKPKVQTFELQANKFGSGSISGGDVNSEKSRSETTKTLFSQPVDLWGSFQPGHEDKLEDFLKSIHRSSQSKPGRESYMNKSFDSNDESSTQEKMETFTEKSAGLSNQQFKKAFVNSLEKKGLGHTIQYLINPMIDLKALKSFSQKDFHLFPHISQEEKQKIVKIIQDIIEEDALLSEVNTVNDFDGQGRSFFSDEGSFCKQLGSFDKDQDFMFNLTNQLERFSHQ